MDYGFICRENRRLVHPWGFVQTRENEPRHTLLSAPEVVHFSVTSNCNLDCPFCYRLDNKDMSTEQITGFIDELARMRVFQLAIGGGEPLLRDDLPAIIDYCYKKNIVPNLTTNGTLLNSSFLKQVSGKVGQINISSNEYFDREKVYKT